MTHTTLVIPFVVDETNRQRFLLRELELPQPLPAVLYLGQLPPIEGLRVLEIEQTLTAVPAHLQTDIDPYRALTPGPIYDVETDTNYIILDAGNEHELCIPFLLEHGWNEESLPTWLLSLISKQRPNR